MLLIKNLTLPSLNVNFQNNNNKFCSKKLKKSDLFQKIILKMKREESLFTYIA